MIIDRIGIVARRAASLGLRCKKSGAAAVALLVAACGTADGAPAGQVVARVNGDDITLSALRAEMAAGNPAGGEDAAAVKRALQRIVDRTLLAQAARAQDMHKSRDFVLAREREERDSLAALAERQAASGAGTPKPAEVDRFIIANASMFGDRKLFVLDQIRFPRPADLRELSYLEPARSLDEVAAALASHGVAFERAPSVLDSAGMNGRMAARVEALPPGEVFVLTTADMVLANEIRERRSAAVDRETARRAAAMLLARQAASRAVEKRVAALRRSAEIDYQPGYAPATRRGSPGAG